MLYTQTLCQNRLFQSCYKQGDCVFGKFVTVYARQNHLPYNRLGITTGKKIGNAVTRARARRMIRAAYHACEEQFPIGLDLVIVARQGIDSQKSTVLLKFLQTKTIPILSTSSKGMVKKRNAVTS